MSPYYLVIRILLSNTTPSDSHVIRSTMAAKNITALALREINRKLVGKCVVLKDKELESAVARPLFTAKFKEGATETDCAASLAYGIIKGHPFLDGNKRTAFWAANEYLQNYGAIPFTHEGVDSTKDIPAMTMINDAHEKVARNELDETALSAAYTDVLNALEKL